VHLRLVQKNGLVFKYHEREKLAQPKIILSPPFNLLVLPVVPSYLRVTGTVLMCKRMKPIMILIQRKNQN